MLTLFADTCDGFRTPLATSIALIRAAASAAASFLDITDVAGAALDEASSVRNGDDGFGLSHLLDLNL